MRVNLFASEEMFPEMVNPVQMAVDTDGRLFVSVWPSYPHWNPTQPRTDRLICLPDENGDGVADKCIVFADKFNSITSFEFWGGGVLVADNLLSHSEELAGFSRSARTKVSCARSLARSISHTFR